MTEDSAHLGSPVDPADAGGNIGVGLVPDEVVEGQAEAAAHTVGPQPDEGLVEPGGGTRGGGGPPPGGTAAGGGSGGAGGGPPGRRRGGGDGEPMSLEDQPTQQLRRP